MRARSRGEDAVATVQAVRGARGHGRPTFRYRLGGSRHALTRSIRRSARARGSTPGDTCVLRVDPGRPRRVLLAGLHD